MSDIARSFDDTPSKDGAAMSELWFHDLVPTERPAPSLFKLMWNQALASVTPGRSNFDGPGPPATPAPREAWPQTSLESAVQSAEPPRDAPPPQSPEPVASTSPEPVASPSIDATDEPATALPSPAEDSQPAQPESAQPSEQELPSQPSDTLPEKPAVQTAPVLPSEDDELQFDDLIPNQSEPLYRPIASPVQEADKEAEREPPSQTTLPIRRSPGPPVAGPAIGIGRQGLPPKAGPKVPRLSKAPLLRGTALDLLLSTILPTPLNEGDAEYIASVFPLPYGQLTGKLPSGFQAHHLNQSGAYGKVIPHNDGVAVGMYGDAITKPGTQHYVHHETLEPFWDRYREGGDLFGTKPTNAEYGQADQLALGAAGYSPEAISYLSDRAAAQRAEYGLLESDHVPDIPKRIRRPKTAVRRLQE